MSKWKKVDFNDLKGKTLTVCTVDSEGVFTFITSKSEEYRFFVEKHRENITIKGNTQYVYCDNKDLVISGISIDRLEDDYENEDETYIVFFNKKREKICSFWFCSEFYNAVLEKRKLPTNDTIIIWERVFFRDLFDRKILAIISKPKTEEKILVSSYPYYYRFSNEGDAMNLLYTEDNIYNRKNGWLTTATEIHEQHDIKNIVSREHKILLCSSVFLGSYYNAVDIPFSFKKGVTFLERGTIKLKDDKMYNRGEL